MYRYFRDDDKIPLCWMMIMMRLFVCTCYDYICGLAGICMCIMMTFLCAKDYSIKPVQIQNKYAKKDQNNLLKLAVASV